MRRLTLSLLALVAAGCGTPQYQVIVPKPVQFSAAKKPGCQGSCMFTRAKADELSELQVDALLREASSKPVGEESEALDTLLFHDEETRQRLASGEAPQLSPAWDDFFRTELAKTQAYFTLRITDEHGQVRATVPETAMALGVKLHMEVEDGIHTGPFNANGTLVRVAKDRVWIRM
jgi:hypothetical protein